jgi:hypothetical protein
MRASRPELQQPRQLTHVRRNQVGAALLQALSLARFVRIANARHAGGRGSSYIGYGIADVDAFRCDSSKRDKGSLEQVGVWLHQLGIGRIAPLDIRY